MRTIHWNKLARRDYFETIDFLLQYWSEKEAQKFIDEIFEIESMLTKGNIEFQNTNRIGIKRCVINKQITLFYRIINLENIEFLRLWNNNQSLKNLKL